MSRLVLWMVLALTASLGFVAWDMRTDAESIHPEEQVAAVAAPDCGAETVSSETACR